MSAYVYVSCAEDGEIALYTLQPDGALVPVSRFPAGKQVMPMALHPGRRHLVAALRGKPFTALGFAIDDQTGALTALGGAPLAESLPYITFDCTGRWLLGASYGGNVVSVNPVAAGLRIGAPQQVIPTARNAHAIITDRTNRFVFVPHLGTDQVFQFLFDERTGRLASNTPPLVQLAKGTGPRHLVTSPDNRFVFVLCELTAEVVTLALDAATGLLTASGSVSALHPGSTLVPGAPRPTPGRNVENDIWASDVHLTPDGRFLYAAERTSSTINALSVDAASGRLTYLASFETEKQPRGFAIDPTGRFMVVSGEKSERIACYAIDGANGALRLLDRYPTGRGANWVCITSPARA